MTPQKCTALVQGRRYSGVFFDTCYASESLDDTEFVIGCKIPCPGSASQICGGNAADLNTTRILVRQNSRAPIFRRDAPASILLTFYQLAVVLPGTAIVGPDTTIVVPPTTIVGPGVTISDPSVTATITTPAASLPDSPAGTINVPYIAANVPTTAVGPGATVITNDGIVVTQAPSPLGPVLVPSPLSPGSAITSVITTVTYMIVDPMKSTALVPVEICTTLYYKECRCPTQVVPTVLMATYLADCDKCGANGQSKVTITVPN
ncbi:hypothetical protein LZ30DRAFT_560421, partial [Colletotrichum cereale]